MDQSDGDGFGGLSVHGEIGIGAPDVPRHALPALEVNDLTGLHRSVGWNQRRVGQRDVPRGGGGFTRIKGDDLRRCFEFDPRCGDIDLNVVPVVVLSDFFN